MADEGHMIEFQVQAGGERLDKLLAAKLESLSRSQVQALIRDGQVLVNGRPVKASYRLGGGEAIAVSLPVQEDAPPAAEVIPLDVLYEDDQVAVVNKPAGMVVHPAFGHTSGSLVNAVLARFLTDGFLHPAVRERGGAYGGGASFDTDAGAFSFYSYRDPRLADTLADFDRALDWLASSAGAANDKLLEEAILGVIRGLDKPRSPAGAAVHWFYSELHGRSAAFRAEFRRRVLATTLDDLRAVAARYLAPASGVVGVVTHAGERSTIERMGLPQFSF